jgi:hypothetical protein
MPCSRFVELTVSFYQPEYAASSFQSFSASGILFHRSARGSSVIFAYVGLILKQDEYFARDLPFAEIDACTSDNLLIRRLSEVVCELDGRYLRDVVDDTSGQEKNIRTSMPTGWKF